MVKNKEGECRVCEALKNHSFPYPWPWELCSGQKAPLAGCFLVETMHKSSPVDSLPGTSSGAGSGSPAPPGRARRRRRRWGGAAGLQPRDPHSLPPSSIHPCQEGSSKIPAAPPGRYAEGGGTSVVPGQGAPGEGPRFSVR